MRRAWVPLQFALSRGDTTPVADTWKAVTTAAPTLTQANLPMTLWVQAPGATTLTKCSGLVPITSLTLANAADTAGGCATALTNGVGLEAQVSLTYPCNLEVVGYAIYNFNLSFPGGICSLPLQVTERVQ